MLKNSKSPFPNHTKIYTGQPFAIYTYLRNKTDEKKKKYTKQRKLGLTFKKIKARILLLPRCKKHYCQQIVLENIYSEKLTSTQKIALIYNDKILKMKTQQGF